MSEQEAVMKKKKKLTSEEKKKRNILKKLRRKNAARYTLKLDIPKLRVLGYYAGVIRILPEELKLYQIERMIFNLLVKAYRNSGKCKYALTKEAIELANRIKLTMINKHEFRIEGMSAYELDTLPIHRNL